MPNSYLQLKITPPRRGLPNQFFRLWDFEVDFAAATYADRRITGKVLKDAMNAAKPEDLETTQSVSALLARHMRYIATHNLGTDHKFKPEFKGDFMTVASVATGFMLISRNVVESIVANGHADPLERTGRLPIYRDAPRFADFFSHHKTPEGDAFFGEDQSFCRRWILGCGGKIWVDRRSKVKHIGEFAFEGDYSFQSGILDDG